MMLYVNNTLNIWTINVRRLISEHFTFLLLLLLWCSLDFFLYFFSLSLLLLLSLSWWWCFFVFPSGCSRGTGGDSTIRCVRTGSFSSSRKGLQSNGNNNQRNKLPRFINVNWHHEIYIITYALLYFEGQKSSRKILHLRLH